MTLAREQDAFGHAFRAYLDGGRQSCVVERDDGYLEAEPLTSYFADYRDWGTHQKRAIRYARGRVLDVGCGAGRHALYLQDKGLDVLAIDASPGAIHVCRQRGVKETRLVSITQVSRRWGCFDSVLMLGNNFGLVANPKRAKWLFQRIHGMTSERGRIIAETFDPGDTVNPFHRVYQRQNRARGRLRGQIRLRIRYQKYATPWFDYLFVSRNEMKSILRGTGWRIAAAIPSSGTHYIAVLEKG